jgi:arylsulfatase A-like enzyme
MPGATRFVIVLVVDGLRPDHITAEDTPTLFRLRREGVDYTNGHAVFPTVTRVNAATIATGMQPGTHGIVGNQLYAPAVDGRRAFDTGNYRNLRTLAHPRTLADRLHAAGLRLAGVSSGSTGSAFLLNPRAPAGVGALVNGYFDPGTIVAWPPEASATILDKFGAPPDKKSLGRFDAVVTWTQRVLREFVLPELRPDVVIDWVTEPDHTQHKVGVGSPEAREAIRHADGEIAHVLAGLDPTTTDVFVVSDHGFTTNTAGIDVVRALVDAGLKAAPDSTDVILASSGQAVGVHVADHDVRAVARFVQSQEWGGVVFTRGRAPGDPHGIVDGTFALELIHLIHDAHGPDLLFTFPWTDDASAFGAHGTDRAAVGGGAAPYHSDHGSMSPWNVRNTFFCWGADFKRGATVHAPAGNADVAPTILALLGVDDHDGLDGRVLHEAFANAPAGEPDVDTRIHTVNVGAYRAAIQVSDVDGRRYVDKSWRVVA